MEEAVLVCTTCFHDHEYIVYNINGRCDCCGSTDWEYLSELERSDS